MDFEIEVATKLSEEALAAFEAAKDSDEKRRHAEAAMECATNGIQWLGYGWEKPGFPLGSLISLLQLRAKAQILANAWSFHGNPIADPRYDSLPDDSHRWLMLFHLSADTSEKLLMLLQEFRLRGTLLSYKRSGKLGFVKHHDPEETEAEIPVYNALKEKIKSGWADTIVRFLEKIAAAETRWEGAKHGIQS